MNDNHQKTEAKTESPSIKKLEEFKQLFPGVISDGVLDAGRLGELLQTDVSGLKGGKERFGLMWSGKQKAVEAREAESYAALIPDFENSINWDSAQNVFIEGDNLEVLKLLQNAYNDKIKMIYIDPPYNTGNDFVYNDDFSDPKQRYLEVTGQVDADGNRLTSNTETSGRKHSNWLTMMYPRLDLARNLLTEDGMIFVSIDDNEVHNLRFLMDEVFGPENFVSILNWKKRGTGGQVANNALIDQVEYILVFARNLTSLKLSGVANPQAGGEKWRSFRKAGGQWQRRFRPKQYFPLYVDSDMNISLSHFDDATSVFPRDSSGADGFWENGLETALKRVEKGELRARIINGKLQIEQLEIAGATSNAGNYIDIPSTRGANEIRNVFGSIVFENAKPMDLLYYLLEIAGVKSGDIVLDFFAGSGSFGHAVAKRSQDLKSNINFLLVNLDEPVKESSNAFSVGYKNVCELTRERLRFAVKEFDVAGGVRIFRIGPSKIRTAQISGEGLFEMSQISELESLASQLELAHDLLLRQGVMLSAPNARLEEEGGQNLVALSGGNVQVIIDPGGWLVGDPYSNTAAVLVFVEDAFSGRDALKAQILFEAKKVGKKMVSY
jgi:adenine-specific DNA-methyltransferase